MAGQTYGPQVMEHYLHPHNVGSYDPDDPQVGTAMVGSMQLGQVLKLQIRVSDATISGSCFRAYGCGATIAAGSLLTGMLVGRSLDQALAINSQDIMQELQLPAAKMHCALLAQDAVNAAISDYRAKAGLSS